MSLIYKMDINKEENLLDNLNTAGKSELKELYKDEDDNKNENAEQEVPEEAQLTLDKPKAEDIGDNGIKKKDEVHDAIQFVLKNITGFGID